MTVTATDPTETHSLRDLVRTTIEGSTIADPAELAMLVLDQVEPGTERALLGEVLTTIVREQITQRRRTHYPSTSPVSAKRAAISEAWRRKLTDRYPGADGQWRLLRDMTSADLLAAAAERRDHAERNLAKAVWLEGLAEAVGAGRVADLGDARLAVLLSDPS